MGVTAIVVCNHSICMMGRPSCASLGLQVPFLGGLESLYGCIKKCDS